MPWLSSTIPLPILSGIYLNVKKEAIVLTSSDSNISIQIELNNIVDSGSIIYGEDNIYAGGSGPLCLPITLFDYILETKKYKKILVVGTGSLHSIISSNQCVPMPGVSHAVGLEVLG